ncbi:MAG: glutamine-synthetase adenylyltransferase [Paracoccaceae bacterium]|nr:MAG: glutamine-synthetase adenylyltransferase [Paracoccaceae bacterium]
MMCAASAFAARLTRCPIPFEPQAAADTRAAFADLAPDLRDLLAGTAGCSPFLKGLITRESVWLRVALTLAPETALRAVLAPLDDLGPDDLPRALRQAKARVALLAGLADLGGVWPLESVTGALTALADRAVHLAMMALVAEEIRRGRLPGATAEDAATAGGMVTLAMGKMGAAELNYSSDIDLICLFDDARYPGAEQEARAAFIRVTRKMSAWLSDMTAEGYVFRTDLRLRPDAAVTPVCLSMAAAEHYYEAQGRTWERAAYIKARPCGGDLAAGARFLKALTPFVWRRHLDFAAIQDAHDMRLRIRDHRRLHGPVVLEGHNLKLGQGGIREIEFFTQTRQLIAGGRDATLRDRGTVGGLAALAARGWVPAAVARELTDHYRAHREVEHRIQMVNDAQTHDLPGTPEGIERIARLSGQADTAMFRKTLLDRLAQVEGLTEGFFAPGRVEDGPPLSEAAQAVVDGWKGYAALRSDRAREVFRRLRPQILKRLARAASPDEALAAFDGFLRRLPAGVQVFSLFDANPSLIDLMGDIAGTSPALARHLARNAGVLDAVIGGDFFAPWPGVPALTADLAGMLDGVPDYERKLDQARAWAREWHFRTGVHHLRGLIDAFEAGKCYADLAEAVIAGLWPSVVAEFARKHGMPPGRGAVVLGMGSVGAGRLNAGSDLDLIVIYDAEGAEASEGPRPLAARAYFARLTQAMVTALTAQMAEGRLYEVDMRLRPSGRQGPVATSVASFESYQMDEAWTWEHLALTRARVLAGNPGLGADVEAIRRRVLVAKGPGRKVIGDVAAMRARLRAAKPMAGVWEAKNGPGRLMDIELLAQTCALTAGDPARRVEAQLRCGVRSGFLTAAEECALLAAYRLCWRLQAGTRLLTDRPLEMEKLGEGGRAFLARETGETDAASLIAHLTAATDAAAAVIGAKLPESEGDGDDTG